MGTSRGDGFGKFTWLEGLFGGGSGGKTESAGTRNFRRVFWALIIVAIVLKIALPSDKTNSEQEEHNNSSGTIVNNAVKAPSDMIAFQSGTSEIDLKIDSMYHQERKGLSQELIHAGIIESKTKEDKENYKKAGGREVSEIGRDISKLVNKEKQSRDSLKTIYTKIITKHVEEKTEKLKRKISDSLKQYTKGKPVNGDVVKYLLKRRKALMADSLGKLYGTLDIVDPSSASIDKSKVKGLGTEGTPLEKKAPVSDILYMVILMIAGVGLYSFLFKNKSLQIYTKIPFNKSV